VRKVIWMGSSKKDLLKFPEDVKGHIGYALHLAQNGEKHQDVKPLKGVEGGVFEVVSDFDTNTFRTVYAVKIGNEIYVLHAFQKKSKTGIETPKSEIDLVKARLKDAKEVAKLKDKR
jgi:phage-related protein